MAQCCQLFIKLSGFFTLNYTFAIEFVDKLFTFIVKYDGVCVWFWNIIAQKQNMQGTVFNFKITFKTFKNKLHMFVINCSIELYDTKILSCIKRYQTQEEH